MYVER